MCPEEGFLPCYENGENPWARLGGAGVGGYLLDGVVSGLFDMAGTSKNGTGSNDGNGLSSFNQIQCLAGQWPELK